MKVIANTHLIKEWNYYKNKDYDPNKITIGSGRKFWWICKKKHEWKVRVPDRLKKNSGCPFCVGQRATPDKSIKVLYPELLEEWNDKREPVDFLPMSNKKVKWICRYGHKWSAVIADRIRKNSGCPRCFKRISDISQKWLDKIKIDKDKREILIKTDKNSYEVDGINFKNKIIYEFYGCFWHGCPKCCKVLI